MSALQIIALAIAGALALVVVGRRRRLGRERLVLLLAAAAALAVYGTGLLDALPDPEAVVEDLARALGDWTYVLVGGLTFLETGAFVGLVVPGETTVIVGGVIAGQGEIDIVVLIGIVWCAAILGDSVSFLVGRRLGRGFLLRHGPRVKITPERLEQVEQYFRRHGGKTIVAGRFLGLVRALAPFVAGSSRVPYLRFLPYSVLGTGLWAATFSLLGYAFWRSFDRVADVAGRATVGLAIVVAVTVGAVAAHRRLRRPEDRRRLAAWLARQAERPALRPAARVARPLYRHAARPFARALGPPLRFARERLTPGSLGIELTSTLATAAAGLYAFAAYAVVLAGEPRRTPLDAELLDVARDLRAEPAVDAVSVLTDLAALPVLGPLVLLAALVLAWRRRVPELVTLVAGFVALVASVQLAKAGIDRPRPDDGLVVTEGASYPSGHAAYATTYVILAVLARRALPSLAGRAALVVAMIGVAAFVGLSRVYLGVHFGSDVIGGWGLGLGVYALVGTIALVAVHIRHNGAVPEPSGSRRG